MNIQQLLSQYPYEKPRPQVQLWLLLFITIGGLIALFLAAYHAFQLVASPPQAFFAALLIEVGLVVEAIALINRPKTFFPWAGLIVGFVVSGSYNYTQAAKAGQGLGGFELFALAFGPLSALAFVSLTLGNELRAYQEKTTEWENQRVEWAEKERKRLETKEERRQAKREQVTSPVVRPLPVERVPEYDELLQLVRERSAENPFTPTDVQEWLERQKTASYDLINYGKELGVVHQIGRGKYIMNGKD